MCYFSPPTVSLKSEKFKHPGVKHDLLKTGTENQSPGENFQVIWNCLTLLRENGLKLQVLFDPAAWEKQQNWLSHADRRATRMKNTNEWMYLVSFSFLLFSRMMLYIGSSWAYKIKIQYVIINYWKSKDKSYLQYKKRSLINTTKNCDNTMQEIWIYVNHCRGCLQQLLSEIRHIGAVWKVPPTYSSA